MVTGSKDSLEAEFPLPQETTIFLIKVFRWVLEVHLPYSKSTDLNTNLKIAFTVTFRMVFDQISGYLLWSMKWHIKVTITVRKLSIFLISPLLTLLTGCLGFQGVHSLLGINVWSYLKNFKKQALSPSKVVPDLLSWKENLFYLPKSTLFKTCTCYTSSRVVLRLTPRIYLLQVHRSSIENNLANHFT